MMRTEIAKDICERSADMKNHLALKDGTGKSVTYGELADMLAYASVFFKDHGIGRRRRIAVVAESGLDLGVLFFLISENCAFVPLDPGFSTAEFEKRFNLLNVDMLLVEAGYEGAARQAWQGTVISYSMDHGSLQFEMQKPSEDFSGGERTGSDIALVLTTSGTTSTPKVVPLTHENLLVAARKKIEFFQFTKADTDLIFTGLFKGTSINSMLATILSGGTVLIADGFSHTRFLEMMKGDAISWFTASPVVLNSLADYAGKRKLDLEGNALRFIRSSGAPLKKQTKEHLEDVFGVPVIQTYGMTETRTITSTYGLSTFKEGSVGVSLGVEVKIKEGEILVKGPNVFSGYENNDSANDAAFSDGWFRTGDLGYVDEDGYVFITGRAKEMINRGGEKISPYEVEDAILQTGKVKDAAVFPYPNGFGSDDAGAAVVLLEEGAGLTLKDLRSQLSGKVSPFKMPSLLYVLDEIPVSTSGKIQRKMLFEILNSRYPHVLASGKTEKPTWSEKDMSDTEGQLARIWMEILDVKSVDPSDNFFDLGGDSLAAAELFVAIEETFGVQISLDDLFASKTLGELARRVESGSKSDYRFLVKIKNGNVGKPLFLVHTIGGDIVTYHAISKKMRADRRVWGIKFSREADWEHPIDFGQLADRYIAEIKRIQPQGPYRLMGYCHGGVLAYYLACRLKERGEEVELLAMLDSVMGSLSAGKGHFGIKKRFWYALVDLRDRNVQEFTALVAKKTASFFRVLKHKAQYRIYDHVCRGGSKRLLKFVSSLVMLKRAKEDTPLERYEGKMHYFLPMRTAKGSAPSIDYWKRMAQEVEVVEFTGTHNDMMSEKAAILAKKIEEILEKADG